MNNLHADSPIKDQIRIAFNSVPNLSSTLHGKRKIIEGQRGRTTSLFPSQKSRGALPMESRLELAHAVMLERDRSVRQFRTQAISIPLDGGKYAIPDFLVECIDGRFEVHEVKPSISALTGRELNRFEWAEKILSREGIKFRLVESSSLPTNSETDRLLNLYTRGHTHKWTNMQIDLAIESLTHGTWSDIQSMHTCLRANDLPIQLVEFLLFHRYELVLRDVNAIGRELTA